MKSIFIFLLCAMTSLLANAQTSFSGKVTDDKGEALFAAQVVLLQNGKIVTGGETDFDGNFSISGIDPGTYDVRTFYTGLKDLYITNYIVKAGRDNKLNIQMKYNTEEIGEIAVKSHIYHQRETTLKGKVTDDKGELLFAASIILLQNGKVVTGGETDFDGIYTIKGIEPGYYKVHCSYTGMSDHTIEAFLINAGQENQLG